MLTKALILDLIGVPEYLLGLYLARWFLWWVPDWKRSLPTLALGAAAFVASGVYGLLLRYVLLGEITPSFISFAFGIELIRHPGTH